LFLLLSQNVFVRTIDRLQQHIKLMSHEVDGVLAPVEN
jgi:hypothetical protein